MRHHPTLRGAGRPEQPRGGRLVGGHDDGAGAQLPVDRAHDVRVDAQGRALQAHVEPLGQLRGQRLHATCGQRRTAVEEGPDQQARHPGVAGPGPLQEHAGQEGLQDAAQVPMGTHVVEGLRERARRGVAGVRSQPGGQAAVGGTQQRAHPAQQAGQLAWTPQRRRAAGREEPGLAPRVAEVHGAVVGRGPHPGRERGQPERGDVDPAAYGGVGGVEQLEAVVDQVAVDLVGAHAAADPVGPVEHEHRQPGLLQASGAAQAGEPGAHHHDVVLAHRGHRPRRRRWPSST